MANIGELFVKIDADTKSVDSKFNKTKKQAKQLGDSLGKYVTLPMLAVGAGAIALTKQVGTMADKLLDLEQITGLSTDTLQEFKNISTVAGVSFEGLTGIVQKFTSRLPTIEAGTSESAKAFEKLGVSLKDTNGEIRSSEELVPELITSLQSIENVTERNAVAQQVFGRSLGDLAPVLGMTAEQTKKAREEAHELGLVWSKDGIKAANDFRVQSEQLTEQFKMQGVELGTALIPLMQDLIPVVSKIIDKVSDGVEAFANTKDSTKKLALGIIGLTAAISPAIKVVTGLKVAITALASPAGAITAIASLTVATLTLINAQTGLIDKYKESKRIADAFANGTATLSDKLAVNKRAYNEVGKELEAYRDMMNRATDPKYKKKWREKVIALSSEADGIHATTLKIEAEIVAIEDEIKATAEAQRVKEEARLQELFAIEAEKTAEIELQRKKKEIIDQELLDEEEKRQAVLDAEAEKIETIKAMAEEWEQKRFEQSATEIELLENEKEKAIELAQGQAEVVANIEETYALRTAELKKKLDEEENLRIEETKKKKLQADIDLIESYEGYSKQITSFVDNIQTIQLNNIESRKNADIAALDEQLLGTDKFNSEKKRIEEEAAIKSWEIQKGLQETKKAADLASIASNTAVAITTALAQLGPIAGAIATAGLIVSGGVQAASVLSQPAPPKPAFAQGGVVKGRTEIVAGEDRADVLIGMGAKGDPLIQELADRLNDGKSSGNVYNFYTTYGMQSPAQLRKMAKTVTPYINEYNEDRI